LDNYGAHYLFAMNHGNRIASILFDIVTRLREMARLNGKAIPEDEMDTTDLDEDYYEELCNRAGLPHAEP
jgi:hypothetical protein